MSANNRYTSIGYVLVVVFAVVTLGPWCISVANEVYVLHFSTSPAKAYALGTKYLDAEYPHRYDLERAQVFFHHALEVDPHYPHAHHQLARIAFLKGDFPLALKLINQELAQQGTQSSISSHYVKGLILGYMDRFEEAAESYAVFLRIDPTNWAAQNDYAWVLIKLHRYGTALEALDTALKHWPDNAWLHSNRATALFELGRLEEAREAARTASLLAKDVTEKEWLQAYPGNDPRIAAEGVAALQSATELNERLISASLSSQ